MAITINLLQETQVTRLYSITIDNTNTVFTTVTTSHSDADTWVNNTIAYYREFYTNRELIIGVGIQSAPTGRYFVATLQLSANAHCLIFHLCHSHTPFTPIVLRRFLLDHRVTFVCLEDHIDIRLGLTPQSLGFRRHMPVNLRLHVRGWSGNNVENYSVPRIAREILGVSINETDMGSTLSYWEDDHLPVAQIEHATLGASVACWLGMRLQAWRLRR